MINPLFKISIMRIQFSIFLVFLFSILLSDNINAQKYRWNVIMPTGKLFNNNLQDNNGQVVGDFPGNSKATLRIYEFDPFSQDPDHTGALLYEGVADKFAFINEVRPVIYRHEDLNTLKDYIYGDWLSTNVSVSFMALDQKIAKERKETPGPVCSMPRPVILELALTGSPDIKGIKFPGFPLAPVEMYQNVVDFRKILEAVKKPLDYPDYVIVAAHRGYWKDYPENSYPAYDLAVAVGADMVELDTRITKDGVLVAFHDECLDRITTGSGKLKDYTWEQVKQFKLRDRFGNPTGMRIVSIEEALLYLKNRALVNLDIKERVTKTEDLLTPTFRKALEIAQTTGTLGQLVVKGKMYTDEMQDLLDGLDLKLSDFIYTPVVFGWDTEGGDAKLLNRFVMDWLQSSISGIELTYKVGYDPILQFIPKAINRGIRSGVYTFWPEDENGVIAEDNINNKDNYCKYNYRQYYFWEENAWGDVPNYAAVSGGSSGDPISPDDRDYGGGSYDYVNYRSKKVAKPDFMNDGRGDWDWLFEQGADFVITDRPELMIEYLKVLGKRKLEKAVLREVTVPDCSLLEDGVGGKKRILNLRGLVRKVDDYHVLDFFVPDTRFVNVDTNLVLTEYKQYSNGKTREDVRKIFVDNHYCYCSTLFSDRDSSKVAAIRKFPLRTLPEWSKIYPGYDIYMNANWFDVKSPWPIDDPDSRKTIPKAPYKEPCTDVFGYWQSTPESGKNTGNLLTINDKPDPSYHNFDALLMTIDGTIKMVKKADIPPYFADPNNYKSRFAVGGYILAANGSPVPYNELPDGTNKTVAKKRSLIGLNGDIIIFAEFQSPMMEPYEAAYLMVNEFKCKDVFMMDAGGSSTMLSSRGQFPALESDAGPYLTSGSAPEDKNLQDVRVFRPVPNFLSVKVKKTTNKTK